jgi:hypothetical protein
MQSPIARHETAYTMVYYGGVSFTAQPRVSPEFVQAGFFA